MDDTTPNPTVIYTKRSDFVSQRGKVWHIRSTQPDTVTRCGTYQPSSWGSKQRTYANYLAVKVTGGYVETPNIPSDHIICTRCERETTGR